MAPILSVLLLASTVLAAPTLSHNRPRSTETWDLSNVTVAAVRAAPVGWPSPLFNKDWSQSPLNLNATVQYGVELIETAASHGARLLTFPETWYPGYPKGYDLNNWMELNVQNFIDNALVVDSPPWKTLLQAAIDNDIYLGLGFTEKADGKLFMAQALISPEGEVLIHRHKLRPSGSERALWSDGTIDQLQVVSTPIGRIGMLECWEHFHPAMTYPILAQSENIHIGAWPYMPDAKDAEAQFWETLEVNGAAARTYAVNSGAITVAPSVGNARILSGLGLEIAEISASVSYEDEPIIYASINTTSFSNATYNTNGEQSWGILNEMVDAFPSYIPKVNGTFRDSISTSVASLEAAAANFTKTTGQSAVSDVAAGASVSIPSVPTGLPATSASAAASTGVEAVSTPSPTSGATSEVAKRGLAGLFAIAAVALLA